MHQKEKDRSKNRLCKRTLLYVGTFDVFCRLFSMRMSKIRHQYAILTPSWQVSPALLTFRWHLPVTKADVLLTFCTYKVLYAKKPAVKTPGGTCQVAHWWRWWDARGHQHQRCRHGVGLLVGYLFCARNPHLTGNLTSSPQLWRIYEFLKVDKKTCLLYRNVFLFF